MDSDAELGERDHVLATTEIDEPVPTTGDADFGYDGGPSKPRSETPPSSSQILALDTQVPTSYQNGAIVQQQCRSQSLLKTSIYPGPTSAFAIEIPSPKFAPLSYATSRSGVVYDVRMRFHTEPIPEDPDEAHPEQPRRISEIFNELIEANLVEDPQNPQPSPYHMLRINIRQATPAEICLVHSPEHVKFVQSLAGMPDEFLFQLGHQHDSIYFHNKSWLSASLAAGGAIEATKAVLSGIVKNAVAIIRPPGHHAEHSSAEGFCFFNNVCVATKVAQAEYPEKCRKVLILDWDVHHGNGVQRAFYDDPNVLYISIHVHQDGKFYPNSDYGDHLHCGEGEGLGRTVNIPWKTKNMGDADYIYAFQNMVMPIATEFDPDLVMISAGFDAAEGDALGGCHVSPAGYGHMTHMLMQLANGKVVACLEGGYNLRSIAKSALAMTRVLMGEPPDRLAPDLAVSAVGISTVQLAIRQQAKFWSCLYPKDKQIQHRQELGSQRLHDVVREWQSKDLWERHKMSTLFILREKISRSFKDQVLATPNYEENRPLLVIFHDPPETTGYPNPTTNRLELHNTFITDVSKAYLDWAIKNDFAVIDVNIPKYLTGIQDDKDYAESEAETVRAEMTRELAFYLWDNYIEVGNASDIIVLGIGDAYSGIISLLSEHDSACDDIDLSITFIAENALRPVRRANEDPSVSKYYANSLIFVSETHPAFHPEQTKKLKKKYGRLKRSPYTNLQEMLAGHKNEVFDELLKRTAAWREQRNQTMGMDIDEEVDGSLSNKTSGVTIKVQAVDENDTATAASSEVPVPVPKATPPIGIFQTSPKRPNPAPRSPLR